MAEFVCEVDEGYRSACKDLPQYPGTRYCVLHYPGEEKNREDFLRVIESKLVQKDYDFSGTVFPEGTADFSRFVFDGNADFTGATFVGEAHFQDAQFSGEETFFVGAQFRGARTYFSEAQFSGEWIDFSRAQFSGEWTDFSRAQFSGERTDFSEAQFGSKSTYFSEAQFSGEWIDFSRAQFSGERTDFSRAQFSSAYTSFASATFTQEVRFSSAIFRQRVEFWGTVDNPVFSRRAWVWFDSLIVEPQLLTFHTVLLHPGWFINTDVRNVDFTDVKWYGMPGGPEGTLNEEIRALTMRDIESPYPLLSEACQRLSANAEENHAYPLANEFHYWRMDALRKGRWNYFEGLTLKDMTRRELWRYIGEHVGLITSLYWALSGYGVRASRALGVLAAIWLTFAAVYFFLVESSPFWVFSASDIWQGIDYARQAAAYSLSALVRLNPSPQSENLNWFQTLVIIEGILGPLQLALTTLAVRRMVMGMSLPTSEK